MNLSQREVYIYDLLRVPSGKKGGIYKNILPEELTAFLINKLLERNPVSGKFISQLILANSIGTMGNMARNALVRSNLNEEISAFTIDFQCGGTYKSLEHAVLQAIANSEYLSIAGGMESNSLMPERYYHQNDPRKEASPGPLFYAQFSPDQNLSLSQSAEKLANEYQITKLEMQKWTVESHQKAFQAFEKKYLNYYLSCFDSFKERDETLRHDISLDKLILLQTNELIDRTNTADLHDGAGVMVIGNCSRLKPIAKILAYQEIGLNSDLSVSGAINSAEKLFETTDFAIPDFDLFEINESFAVKPLSFAKHFGIPHSKINILGSNLAMGHPYAASGVINIINLVAALKKENKKRGLVSAGVAGGMGVSVAIELIE